MRGRRDAFVPRRTAPNHKLRTFFQMACSKQSDHPISELVSISGRAGFMKRAPSNRKMNMLVTDRGRSGPSGNAYGRAGARGAPSGDPVFDQWLNHHLGRLYDPVVQEPIPAELLRLLELRLK